MILLVQKDHTICTVSSNKIGFSQKSCFQNYRPKFLNFQLFFKFCFVLTWLEIYQKGVLFVTTILVFLVDKNCGLGSNMQFFAEV